MILVLPVALGATEIWWAALSGVLHSGKTGSIRWHYVMDLAPPSTTVLFSNQPYRLSHLIDRQIFFLPSVVVARLVEQQMSKHAAGASLEGAAVRRWSTVEHFDPKESTTLRSVNTTQSPLERTGATWSHGQLNATACINQQGAADQGRLHWMQGRDQQGRQPGCRICHGTAVQRTSHHSRCRWCGGGWMS